MPILKGTNSTVSAVLKPSPGDDRFGIGTTSGHKISDPLSYDRAECPVLEHETEPTVSGMGLGCRQARRAPYQTFRLILGLPNSCRSVQSVRASPPSTSEIAAPSCKGLPILLHPPGSYRRRKALPPLWVRWFCPTEFPGKSSSPHAQPRNAAHAHAQTIIKNSVFSHPHRCGADCMIARLAKRTGELDNLAVDLCLRCQLGLTFHHWLERLLAHDLADRARQRQARSDLLPDQANLGRSGAPPSDPQTEPARPLRSAGRRGLIESCGKPTTCLENERARHGSFQQFQEMRRTSESGSNRHTGVGDAMVLATAFISPLKTASQYVCS